MLFLIINTLTFRNFKLFFSLFIMNFKLDISLTHNSLYYHFIFHTISTLKKKKLTPAHTLYEFSNMRSVFDMKSKAENDFRNYPFVTYMTVYMRMGLLSYAL